MDSGDTADESSFHERLAVQICDFTPLLFYLLVLQIIMVVLAAFSLTFIEAGTASHAILKIDIIIIATTITVTVSVMYGCNISGY